MMLLQSKLRKHGLDKKKAILGCVQNRLVSSSRGSFSVVRFQRGERIFCGGLCSSCSSLLLVVNWVTKLESWPLGINLGTSEVKMTIQKNLECWKDGLKE